MTYDALMDVTGHYRTDYEDETRDFYGGIKCVIERKDAGEGWDHDASFYVSRRTAPPPGKRR